MSRVEQLKADLAGYERTARQLREGCFWSGHEHPACHYDRMADLLRAEIFRIENPDAPDPSSEWARALGIRGGKVGGKARAEKLSPEQRKQIAQKAARARWKKNDG